MTAEVDSGSGTNSCCLTPLFDCTLGDAILRRPQPSQAPHDKRRFSSRAMVHLGAVPTPLSLH